MTELIMRFPEAVSGARGMFSSSVIGRDCGDGNWEAWLEFVPTASGVATAFVTGIETRQHSRVALERWASGLTRVYAEGALARALHAETPSSELLAALQEIVAALDRRIPHLERASEPDIAADAKRLRAAAVERIDVLRRELMRPQNTGAMARADAGGSYPMGSGADAHQARTELQARRNRDDHKRRLAGPAE
jgi:hypothetical protein